VCVFCSGSVFWFLAAWGNGMGGADEASWDKVAPKMQCVYPFLVSTTLTSAVLTCIRVCTPYSKQPVRGGFSPAPCRSVRGRGMQKSKRHAPSSARASPRACMCAVEGACATPPAVKASRRAAFFAARGGKKSASRAPPARLAVLTTSASHQHHVSSHGEGSLGRERKKERVPEPESCAIAALRCAALSLSRAGAPVLPCIYARARTFCFLTRKAPP
jgi:hypothetical protein